MGLNTEENYKAEIIMLLLCVLTVVGTTNSPQIKATLLKHELEHGQNGK